MKVLINSKGKRMLWKSGDIHTEEGTIQESKMKDSSSTVSTHKEKNLIKFDAKFNDIIKNLKRGPAVINSKDAGSIIANTGINSKSKIVDAGSGSGFLASYLSNITPHITTYEKNKVHFNIAKSNLNQINPKVKIKNKDISEGIDEKDLDLITLDLPDPENILKHAEKALKSGAYLVCYLPNITQVQSLIKESKSYNFILEKTIETIEREWIVQDRICRPENQILGHTAFLVFFRKY